MAPKDPNYRYMWGELRERVRDRYYLWRERFGEDVDDEDNRVALEVKQAYEEVLIMMDEVERGAGIERN